MMNQASRISPESSPSPADRIVRIFEERGDELRFPDLDGAKLRELQGVVHKEQDAVFALEERLAEAREALVLAEKELRDKAEKAHAYLRIFAVGDEALVSELAEIQWTTGERTGRKRRPTRAAKVGESKEFESKSAEPESPEPKSAEPKSAEPKSPESKSAEPKSPGAGERKRRAPAVEIAAE